MPNLRLRPEFAERVWGRKVLPGPFCDQIAKTDPIGEIWFSAPPGRDTELLVKYLFTSQRLSIQVHPDNRAARLRGFPRGKDEAWYILDADPGAVIGLGLTREVSPEELRAAALDGSIEQLIDWRPAKAGDLFYSPAGTVHVIGAGLSLIEVQQNLDLTYRLYDYGRPRELHLDDGIAVANPAPAPPPTSARELGDGRAALVEGSSFVLEKWTLADARRLHSDDGELLLMPLSGNGRIDGDALAAGSVWRIDGNARLDAGDGIDLLAAYPGALVRDDVCVAV